MRRIANAEHLLQQQISARTLVRRLPDMSAVSLERIQETVDHHLFMR